MTKLRTFGDRDCISTKYRDLQKELHRRPEGYGGKGHKWADTVVALVERFGATSVLDYGCGRGSLVRALQKLKADKRPELAGVRLDEYDPAIDGKSDWPTFADLVVATDVLEHIEPDKLPAVLAHLAMLARKAIFLVVALDPANKTLADGRNAHLILEAPAWWESTIAGAGFGFVPILDALPFPMQYSPEKRQKRWIAVITPPAPPL